MHGKNWLQLAIVVLVPGLCGGAAAQDLGSYHGGMAQNGLVTNQTNITQTAIGEKLAEQIGRTSDRASGPALAADLRYVPSLSRRRENMARFVAKLRPGDPQGAAALEQLVASTDLIEGIGTELARYGLRVDDLADAYAAWWVSAWQGWAGDTSDPSRAQLAAVREQAARALSSTPELAAADAATRQEFAESMLVQAALIGATTEGLKTNPAMKAPLRQAMAQAGQSMGLDFAAMRLTPAGFQLVGASEAGPQPAPAAAPARPAAGDAPGAIRTVVFRMWGDLQFRPTVLFADGTAYDVDDASMEATSVRETKASAPTRWGRWRANGDSYALIDDKGRSSDYVMGGGGLFRSFPAAPGETLTGRYKSVSGSQMGEMSMLSTGVMTFAPDGRFTTARSFSASGSGDVTGVSMAGGSSSGAAGRYTLSGHRIVLTFDNGTTRDLFFGFGGEGRPQRADRDMIFLGATAYVEDN